MTTSSTSWSSAREGLEKKVADFAGTRYAVICSSGRAGILFSLLALGITRGDEAIIPDYACQVIPITVFCTGATPKFCDVDRKTISISPSHLLKVLQPNTKAVIFVYLYGIPVDPLPILEITQGKGIAFISDAAQALGTTIRGKRAVSFGDVGILSFNKFLNVNLGAAAVTDNQEIADKMKSVRNEYEKRSFLALAGYHIMGLPGSKSRSSMNRVFWVENYLSEKLNKFQKKYFQVIDGWVIGNPKLHELQRSKALTSATVSQLWTFSGRYYYGRKLEKFEILMLESEFEELEKRLEERSRIARIYEECLSEEEFRKFAVQENSVPSYMRYPILFSDEKKRSMCIKNMAKKGFVIDYTYEPLHTSPFFYLENKSNRFRESIHMSKHLLPLPVNSSLSLNDVGRIVSIVNS